MSLFCEQKKVIYSLKIYRVFETDPYGKEVLHLMLFTVGIDNLSVALFQSALSRSYALYCTYRARLIG
jgi:hypothetical protein